MLVVSKDNGDGVAYVWHISVAKLLHTKVLLVIINGSL